MLNVIFAPYLLYVNRTFKTNMAVLAENGIIKKIEKKTLILKEFPDAEVKEFEELVLIPGTVNAHNHSFQSLLRGIAADRPFLEWRDKSLYKYSPKMSIEDTYNGALFAFSEMLKCGVTTVCDYFYLHNHGIESDEAVIRAANDLGIRLVLARTMYDWDGAPNGYIETIDEAVENTRFLAEKYAENEMVSILPAPHSLHAASPEMIKAGYDLARELDTKFHVHVAEEPFEVEEVKAKHGGLHTIDYLDSIGVVDERLVIIHGVHLKESEVQLLGQKNGSLNYCPSSNMFLADGITDIPSMMESGVKIALGSDGACSNNRISVFEEMRMTSLLQKANTMDALCVNYQQAFEMGTKNGGEVLDLPIGLIEEEYFADFVGININDLSMQPLSENLEQLLPNIVYSMQPGAIKEVIVGGKMIMTNGIVTTVKEKELLSKIKHTMAHLQNF